MHFGLFAKNSQKNIESTYLYFTQGHNKGHIYYISEPNSELSSKLSAFQSSFANCAFTVGQKIYKSLRKKKETRETK